MVFITGYKVMLSYLDKIWELTKSDSLAALLGSMILLPDGYPIDAAVKDDWNRAVEIATTQVDNNLIMSELAYRSTLVYLKNWLDIATDAEIENVYLELLNCSRQEHSLSCRRPRFSSQHPLSSSQLVLTLAPRP